jgi:transposase-like protein
MAKPYSNVFRARIVRLACSGRSVTSLTKEFEPSRTTIRRWIVQSEKNGTDERSITDLQRQITSIDSTLARISTDVSRIKQTDLQRQVASIDSKLARISTDVSRIKQDVITLREAAFKREATPAPRDDPLDISRRWLDFMEWFTIAAALLLVQVMTDDWRVRAAFNILFIVSILILSDAVMKLCRDHFEFFRKLTGLHDELAPSRLVRGVQAVVLRLLIIVLFALFSFAVRSIVFESLLE